MVKRILVAKIGLAAGCFDAASAGDYMDDDVPAPGCMTETGTDCDTDTTPSEDDAATATLDDTCESTFDCDAGEACVATFDGEIGELECRSTCVPDMDETRWCVDDAACCESGSVCQGRGYCVAAEASSTGLDPDAGEESSSSTVTGSTSDGTGPGDGGTGTSDGGTTTSETGTDTATNGAAFEPDRRRPIRR